MDLSQKMKKYIPEALVRIFTIGDVWSSPLMDIKKYAGNASDSWMNKEIAIYRMLSTPDGRANIISTCNEVLQKFKNSRSVGFLTKSHVKNMIRLVSACEPAPGEADKVVEDLPERFLSDVENLFDCGPEDDVLRRLDTYGCTNMMYHIYEVYGEERIRRDLRELGYSIDIELSMPLIPENYEDKLVVNRHKLWVFSPVTPTVILTLN